MKGKRSRVARRRLHIILICVVIAVAVFFGLFYTTEIEVEGNSRYTDDQIREMVTGDPLSRNTVLMSLFRKNIQVDAPLISGIRVTYVSRNKIRLTVSEKYPIGYLQLNGKNYYFDKDGVVLETTDSDGSTSISAESVSSSDSSVTASSAEIPEAVQSGAAADTDTSGTSADSEQTGGSTDFSPALTDVPLITGLGVTQAEEGQKLDVKDDSVFSQILSLTKLIDKFDIQPDRVELDDSLQMTLYYGNVRVNLGSDENLEEKMTRAAAILPQLGGMSGELHLENYSSDTQNIIFDSDETEESKNS